MIEKLSINKLQELQPLAKSFYASSKYLEDFDMNRFVHNWTTFLEQEYGVIFVSKNIDNEVTGAIGGVKYPDVNSGDLVATEFFWFVDEESRGGLSGIKLLKSFEAWAKENECKKLMMIHLNDLMPVAVRSIYERLGFKAIETHYMKGIV